MYVRLKGKRSAQVELFNKCKKKVWSPKKLFLVTKFKKDDKKESDQVAALKL